VTAFNGEAPLGSIERFLDEIEGGDVEAAIAAVAHLIHPEMRFTSMIGSEIDGRTYIGSDGLREWFQDYSDTFEVQYVDRKFIVYDEGVVVGLFTNTMRGRSSDVELSRDIGTVWEFEDGLVVRAVTYGSQDQVLKAAEAARAAA
jgi:ketosteroid isomerase-like protein